MSVSGTLPHCRARRQMGLSAERHGYGRRPRPGQASGASAQLGNWRQSDTRPFAYGFGEPFRAI